MNGDLRSAARLQSFFWSFVAFQVVAVFLLGTMRAAAEGFLARRKNQRPGTACC